MYKLFLLLEQGFPLCYKSYKDNKNKPTILFMAWKTYKEAVAYRKVDPAARMTSAEVFTVREVINLCKSAGIPGILLGAKSPLDSELPVFPIANLERHLDIVTRAREDPEPHYFDTIGLEPIPAASAITIEVAGEFLKKWLIKLEANGTLVDEMRKVDATHPREFLASKEGDNATKVCLRVVLLHAILGHIAVTNPEKKEHAARAVQSLRTHLMIGLHEAHLEYYAKKNFPMSPF